MLSVRPETRYARSGDVSIAYQVLGDGPFDLVFAPGFVSNVEFGWEEPTLERFYRRLASFCRLIIFDKRGTGLSDRVSGVPDLETRMDDVRAIMDAEGSERAAVLGYSEGAAMAALFAATYPERTPALVLYGTFLTWDWLPEKREAYRQVSREEQLEEVGRRWGTPAYCDELLRDDAPSRPMTRTSAVGMQPGCDLVRARQPPSRLRGCAWRSMLGRSCRRFTCRA